MPQSQTIRLLLIKSAGTVWDQAGRLQGGADLPMTPEGKQELHKHLESLRGTELSVVLSSPDEASLETARAVAQMTQCTVKAMDELRDMNLGLWEGMLSSAFEQRYPKACRQWFDDPAAVTAPEGECLEDVRSRVIGTLVNELERYRRVGAIGLVLRPIARRLVQCCLRSTSTCEFWTDSQDADWFQWYDVPRTWRPAAQVASAK